MNKNQESQSAFKLWKKLGFLMIIFGYSLLEGESLLFKKILRFFSFFYGFLVTLVLPGVEDRGSDQYDEFGLFHASKCPSEKQA